MPSSSSSTTPRIGGVRRFARLSTACAGMALVLISGAAQAQARTGDGGGCNADEARNNPAACRKESGAAKVEAGRGNLTSPGAAAGANATDRCSALSGSERQDCVGRAAGQSTSTSGSVESGGIVKETVTTVPAK